MFDRPALLELRRAARLQPVIKTSFSRSNPVPRGQATVIRPSVRGTRRRQQRTIQSDRLPSYLQSLTNFRPARPSKGSPGKGSDVSGFPKTPGSLQINLLFTMYAEQASGHSADANFYFSKGYSLTSTPIELVELSGIEPLTPCLQSRCSPS